MDLFYVRKPVQIKWDRISKPQMTGCLGLKWHDVGYKTMYVKRSGVNEKSVDHWTDKRLPGLMHVYETDDIFDEDIQRITCFTFEKQSEYER